LLASEPLLKSQALAVSPSENIEKEQALISSCENNRSADYEVQEAA
jgi:hypothetical protein